MLYICLEPWDTLLASLARGVPFSGMNPKESCSTLELTCLAAQDLLGTISPHRLKVEQILTDGDQVSTRTSRVHCPNAQGGLRIKTSPAKWSIDQLVLQEIKCHTEPTLSVQFWRVSSYS